MNLFLDPGPDDAVPRLAAFEGAWAVHRTIRDRLAGEDLRFQGQVRFVPVAGGLRYSEVGELILPQGGTLQSSRDYIFREGRAGIEVLFDDGRPFHRISRAGVTPTDTHWCDPDSYTVSYDFSNWPEWTTLWSVVGPRKDYEMTTRFRPVPPAGAEPPGSGNTRARRPE